jgi:hypothetical protein
MIELPHGDPVIHSQPRAGGGVTNLPLFIQLVDEASQFPKMATRTTMVGGMRHRVRLVPDEALRVLGDKINAAALPPFLQQLTDTAF